MSQDHSDWITRSEFCALLGICTKTATRWEKRGYGPTPVGIGPGGRGRHVRYRRADAQRFLVDLAKQAEQPTAVA